MEENPASTYKLFSANLDRLCALGVLGFYDRLEATEIVASVNGVAPFNVFSLFVTEESASTDPAKTFKWLNSNGPIHLPGLLDWQFGVGRYSLELSAMQAAINTFATTQVRK